MLKGLLIASLVALCTGCLMAQYEDISSQPEYANLINTTYRSREVLLIHGVTLDANYKNVVDAYSITPTPGMSGPEILSRDVLPVGTLVRVVKVLGCKNCIFGGGSRLEVELPDLVQYSKRRATLRFSFGGTDVLLKDGNQAALSSSLFERVR